MSSRIKGVTRMNKHAPKGPIRPKAKKGTFGRVIKKLFGYYPV